MSPGPLTFMAIALLTCSLAYGQNEEIRLIDKLLENYSANGGRPVANATDALEVQLKLHLLHIENLDQYMKVFTIIGWLQLQWTDSFLKWDPSEFGGVEYVVMELSSIWRPDITLFNALDRPKALQSVKAHVSSNGAVVTVEPYRFVSKCPDVKPDQKKPSCTLIFGSWAYDTSRLSVSHLEEKVDIGEFQVSNVYEMLGSQVKTHEKTYPCCPGTIYGSVHFTIELEKRNQEPEVDPNASSATTSVAMATTVAALLALQTVLLPLI